MQQTGEPKANAVTVPPSLKGLYIVSREDTPLKSTHILGGKYYECMQCSLSPKETSLIRTELFGRRGVLIRGGLL